MQCGRRNTFKVQKYIRYSLSWTLKYIQIIRIIDTHLRNGYEVKDCLKKKQQ